MIQIVMILLLSLLQVILPIDHLLSEVILIVYPIENHPWYHIQMIYLLSLLPLLPIFISPPAALCLDESSAVNPQKRNQPMSTKSLNKYDIQVLIQELSKRPKCTLIILTLEMNPSQLSFLLPCSGQRYKPLYARWWGTIG